MEESFGNVTKQKPNQDPDQQGIAYSAAACASFATNSRRALRLFNPQPSDLAAALFVLLGAELDHISIHTTRDPPHNFTLDSESVGRLSRVLASAGSPARLHLSLNRSPPRCYNSLVETLSGLAHCVAIDTIKLRSYTDQPEWNVPLSGLLGRNLESLTCFKFQGEDIDIPLLAPFLSRSSSLTTFSITGFHLGSGIADVMCQALPTESIVSLSLRRDDIGDDTMKPIADFVSRCRSFSALDLAENSIGSLGASALAGALRKSCTFSALNLKGNHIGDDGIRAISSSITRSISLNVTYNAITAEGAKAISGAIHRFKKLKLSRNNISAEGIAALSCALAKKPNVMSSLHLLRSCFNAEAVDLAAVLPGMNSLSELNLGCNDFCYDTIALLSDAFPSGITSLSFDRNDIGPAGAKSLSSSILHRLHCQLVKLNLAYNKIGAEGALALSPALSECYSISDLNLAHNSLGIEGAKTIAAALRGCGCKHLAALDLDGNEIGDEGTAAVVRGLECAHGVDVLQLEDNEMRDEGAGVIFAALTQQFATISLLNLRGNKIDDSGAEDIARVLPQCRQLRMLNLRCNYITPGGELILEAACGPMTIVYAESLL